MKTIIIVHVILRNSEIAPLNLSERERERERERDQMGDRGRTRESLVYLLSIIMYIV